MREERPVFVTDVHLDPSHTLEPVLVPSGYASIFAAVYLHDTIIGVVSLPVRGDSVPGQVLANAIVDRLSEPILRHLLTDRLMTRGLSAVERDPAVLMETPHLAYAGPWPTVTTAICTRGRPDDLRRCLAALGHLDYPCLDLLVVDNAPTDLSVADFIRDSHPGARYAAEPRPGLNWARNRAILEARGDLLAFTDDDAVADPGWLKALVAPMAEDADVMATTGLVLPYELETEAQQLFERHGGLGRGFTRRWVRVATGSKTTRAGNPTTLGTGANMAFRRSLFDAIGGFDPALDAGTQSGAGGDIEMFFRVLKAGHTLVYEPGAIVRHRHRRELAAIQQQLHNWLKGTHAAAVRAIEHHADERWPITAFAARLLLLYFPRRIAAAAFGSTLNLDLVLCELRGLAAGRGAYRAAQRQAAQIEAQFGSASVAPTTLPTESPHQARRLRTSRQVTADIDQPLPPVLPGPDDADLVRVYVTRSARAIGTVHIVTGGAPVGRRRLSEAIVSSCLPNLVDVNGFRRALRRMLVA